MIGVAYEVVDTLEIDGTLSSQNPDSEDVKTRYLQIEKKYLRVGPLEITIGKRATYIDK